MLTSQNAQGVGIVNGIAPPEQSRLIRLLFIKIPECEMFLTTVNVNP